MKTTRVLIALEEVLLMDQDGIQSKSPFSNILARKFRQFVKIFIFRSTSASMVSDAVAEIIARRGEENESANSSRRGSFNASRRNSK